MDILLVYDALTCVVIRCADGLTCMTNADGNVYTCKRGNSSQKCLFVVVVVSRGLQQNERKRNSFLVKLIPFS